ncbi:MAG TPA: hypothetical protein VFY87_04695 [Geminicoccaceae bacterium]|nr:hypothetical protein [Geminicoccaceae bacterium]
MIAAQGPVCLAAVFHKAPGLRGKHGRADRIADTPCAMLDDVVIKLHMLLRQIVVEDRAAAGTSL